MSSDINYVDYVPRSNVSSDMKSMLIMSREAM